MYYTYILRCSDNSLYTGITNNIERRYNEHITKKGAKYTKTHEVIKIECIFASSSRKSACILEYYIKTLKKEQKEALIKGNMDLISNLNDNYTRMK